MLVGAAAGLYPTHALSAGLLWWAFGIALAIVYFVFVYRTFRGRVIPNYD
jgi:uncharacterized membrane protein YfcA